MMAGIILFSCLSAALLGSAVIALTRRTPVVGLAWLVFSFLSLAALLLSTGAEALAFIWVIVYGGAIMVLLVFGLAVVGGQDPIPRFRPKMAVPILLAMVLSFQALVVVIFGAVISGPEKEVISPRIDSLADLGTILMTRFPAAFEIASVLILAALVISLVLARRKA